MSGNPVHPIDGPEMNAAVEAERRPSDDAEPRRIRFDVSAWAIAKLMAGLLLLGVVGNLAHQIRDVLVWAAAALFLAVALNPLVARLEPKLGRTAAAVVVFLGFIVLLLAALAALVAPFVTQVDQLTTGLPNALQDARRNHTFARLDSRFHLVEHARAHADAVPGYVFGTAGTVLGGVVAVTTVLFLMVFLLIELPSLARLVLGQLQPAQRERAVAIAQHANRQVGGYVFGNLVISVICGAVTWVALYLLGVPYSLALAVFMAVFDIIPLVGATIGSIVVIGTTFLLTGTTAGVAIFVIVMVYQQIENHVLQPLIYGHTVQLSSLTVLLAVLVGGAALGLVGALLAIPIAGTLQAVVGEMLESRAERIRRDGPSGEEAVEAP
ncbi:MAG TPA: AI-2E family transporter [Gaiellales bacterium]|nr:AI-2E family transporter [Gaiellales bacterium]